ncbi:hypothetical protein VE03_07437 [Pseudogymnoascus sp. 23342-1-I1]|nr:hypothetical protein VE03_07437 [Pseudogymnoascus sp. 23342-1-I1]
MIAAIFLMFSTALALALPAPLDAPTYHCPTSHTILKCCAGYDKVVFPESCAPVTRTLATYDEFRQMCMYADEKNNGGHMPGCCHGENDHQCIAAPVEPN